MQIGSTLLIFSLRNLSQRKHSKKWSCFMLLFTMAIFKNFFLFNCPCRGCILSACPLHNDARGFPPFQSMRVHVVYIDYDFYISPWLVQAYDVACSYFYFFFFQFPSTDANTVCGPVSPHVLYGAHIILFFPSILHVTIK